MPTRLEQLQKLHAADPKDPFCTYGIALEHAKAQQFDEALRWLDATLAVDPRYCYAFFQKGKVLAEMGQTDAAKAVLEQGIATAQAAGDAHARDEITALLDSLE